MKNVLRSTCAYLQLHFSPKFNLNCIHGKGDRECKDKYCSIFEDIKIPGYDSTQPDKALPHFLMVQW